MLKKALLFLFFAAAATAGAAVAAEAPCWDDSENIDAACVEYTRKEAVRGDAEAQYHLGHIYYWGWGVANDNRAAVSWWRKAAEQGHASAQWTLGMMYKNGYGDVAQDYRTAAYWFRKAAEWGHSLAQSELAESYAVGRGVVEDHREAYIWWLMAEVAEGTNNSAISSEMDTIADALFLLLISLSPEEKESAKREANRRLLEIESRRAALEK